MNLALNDCFVTQAQNDLEEKESMICHQKNKLSMLEQRSNTDKLPQDEQVQALLAEVRLLCSQVVIMHVYYVQVCSLCHVYLDDVLICVFIKLF